MTRQIIYSILALVILLSSAQAQIGDWQDVQDIAANTTIFVQAEHKRLMRCTFEQATDGMLFCALVYRSPYLRPREINFNRSEVRQVLVEYVHESNIAKGTVIGAGVGAAAGASLTHGNADSRLGATILLGTIGAVFGTIFARSLNDVRTKIIYRK